MKLFAPVQNKVSLQFETTYFKDYTVDEIEFIKKQQNDLISIQNIINLQIDLGLIKLQKSYAKKVNILEVWNGDMWRMNKVKDEKYFRYFITVIDADPSSKFTFSFVYNNLIKRKESGLANGRFGDQATQYHSIEKNRNAIIDLKGHCQVKKFPLEANSHKEEELINVSIEALNKQFLDWINILKKYNSYPLNNVDDFFEREADADTKSRAEALYEKLKIKTADGDKATFNQTHQIQIYTQLNKIEALVNSSPEISTSKKKVLSGQINNMKKSLATEKKNIIIRAYSFFMVNGTKYAPKLFEQLLLELLKEGAKAGLKLLF